MRLFTDGAEMGDTLFWDTTTSITAVTTNKRSGAYSYYINGTMGTCGVKYFKNTSEFYFRFSMDTSSGFGVSNVLIAWRNSSTYLLRLSQTASTKLSADVGTSSVASGSAVLTDTWHTIEVYAKIANSEGRFVIYMDGILDIDYTGDTQIGGDTYVDNFTMGRATISSNIYCDDLAMNDTDNSDGKNDNSWCGDGRIVRIYPSGSGTTNNWLNSGSVSGSANYLYVDEIPVDGDSSYTYASGSLSGVRDQYNMSAFGGTGTTITRIYAESRIRKTQAVEGNTIKTGFQTSGSTPQVSGSKVMILDYTRIVGDDALINPATGLPWTESDINSIEYVIETG